MFNVSVMYPNQPGARFDLVFMTGQAGRRVITPRTSILSHRFAGMTLGNHSQLLAGRKEQDLLHDRIIRRGA